MLLLGGFVTIFDLFVVNVAIPSIQRDLGASFAQIGFVLAGYELAFGAFLITGAGSATASAGAGFTWPAPPCSPWRPCGADWPARPPP